MKRLLIIAPCLLASAAAGAAPVEITLLHVNDTHSHLAPYGPKDLRLAPTIGGLSKAATIIAAEKAANPSALFVHGGDLMHGDFFFDEYLGVAELQLLQSLGLDAMVLGNHELDLGPDFLSGVLFSTWPGGGSFPILSTNLDLTGYPLLSNWVTTAPVMKDVSGVKVGLFGLTTPFVINEMPAPAELRTDLVEIAAQSIATLRAQGAQVVICLSHLGLELSREIAVAAPGIDVVVNAHDHVALAHPQQITRAGGMTWIVSAGEYYRWVGRLSLSVDGSVVRLGSYRLIEVDRRVPELPAVAAIVSSLRAGITARYGDVYGRPLALSFGPIPVRAEARCPERDTAIGDLWTDAYRAETRTDIAVEVNGYLDEPLPSGLVVGADVLRVNSAGLPVFDETMRVAPVHLATFTLSGADLIAALETTLVASDDTFPQVSGMRFDFDSRRAPGQKILLPSVRIGGRRLDPLRQYTVTANEIVLMFLPLLGIVATDPQVLDATAYDSARELIRARVLLLPFPEGRIRDVAQLGRGR